MPAPLVIPVVENLATATGYAEKANRVSENKYKLTVGLLSTQQTDCIAKMDKEMFKLKHELAHIKPKRPSKRSGKREADRGSPVAKFVRVVSCESPVSDVSENKESKRRQKGPTMAERNDDARISNLQRRYSAMQVLTRSDLFMDVKTKASQQRLRLRTP